MKRLNLLGGTGAAYISDGTVQATDNILTMHIVDARLSGIAGAVDRVKLAKVADADGLKATANNVVAKVGSASVRIPLLDAELFVNDMPKCKMQAAVGLLAAMSACRPFMASGKAPVGREWSASVRLLGGKAFATNAKSFIEHPAPAVDCIIPDNAVNALLKMPEPAAMGVLDGRVIVFSWPDGSWMTTKTLTVEWPDIAHILDAPFDEQPLPHAFHDAVAKLARYGDDDCVEVADGAVATADGAVTVPVGGLPCFSANLVELSKVPETADTIGIGDRMVLFVAGNARIIIAKLRGE